MTEPGGSTKAAIAAIRTLDKDALERALDASPGSPPGRLIVQASQLAWRGGLALLVRRGGDVNGVYRGYRALHALIQEEPHANRGTTTRTRLACLRWLLDHGADPELTGAFPPARAVLVAAFAGEAAYVDALLAHGATNDGFVAAALGDVRGVRAALAKDPAFATARDVGGLTALQCCAASRMGRADRRVGRALYRAARLLVEHGADACAVTRAWNHDVQAAYFAAASGQHETFELLLQNGANAAEALSAAVWRGRFDMADAAIRAGANPDTPLEGGRTALNELVRWGQVGAALWLLSRGASPNVPDGRGWTAMHQAASRGNVNLLRAVIAAGADLARPDREGFTPVQVAQFVGKAAALEAASRNSTAVGTTRHTRITKGQRASTRGRSEAAARPGAALSEANPTVLQPGSSPREPHPAKPAIGRLRRSP